MAARPEENPPCLFLIMVNLMSHCPECHSRDLVMALTEHGSATYRCAECAHLFTVPVDPKPADEAA